MSNQIRLQPLRRSEFCVLPSAFAVTIPALLTALLLANAPARAQTRSQFIITKGKDTVAVEVFSRDAATLTSEIYQTNGPRTQYTIDLKPDGAVKHVELTRLLRNGQSVGVGLYFLDTLVKLAMSSAEGSDQMEFASRRATPFLAVSFALCEQIIRSTHLDVGKSTTLTAVRMAAGDTATLTVTRFHADSALLSMPDVQMKVALSSTGEVIGGTHMAQAWKVERKTVR